MVLLSRNIVYVLFVFGYLYRLGSVFILFIAPVDLPLNILKDQRCHLESGVKY